MSEMRLKSLVSGFSAIEPDYRCSQEEIFRWLEVAHAKANPQLERSLIKKNLAKYGCSPSHIATRGMVVSDLTHENWDRMEIYRVNERPPGSGFLRRTEFYQKSVEVFFEQFFERESEAHFDDLVHVTCTGYVLPSAAQNLVNKKGWQEKVQVTHLYHMGCLAAVPALRVASAFANQNRNVEVVHTELCSLHWNPAQSDPQDFVAESLFADGMIRYSVGPPSSSANGLLLYAAMDQLIPDSAKEMEWYPSDHSLRMILGPQVPAKVAQYLPGFLKRLFEKAGVDADRVMSEGYFAVHPGGPKILDFAQEGLKLASSQIAHSREILFRNGNMSSATLPHIWKALSEDSKVPDQSWIVSLTFGPGLTLCGAILRKRA